MPPNPVGHSIAASGATYKGGPAMPRTYCAAATGRIAIKVIDHYGDEVLKVYEVGG